MATAQQVLDVARSQLGVKEDPAGSNRVLYTAWYGLVGAWCAMFVSWVAAHAGAEVIIPKHAWTPSGVAWFKARGQWGTQPRVGAIVYFQWPGMHRVSHVGIVEAVNADGTIVTIEGNTDVAGGRTGGRVLRQLRSYFIAGYGYPAYDGVRAVLGAPVRHVPEPAGPGGSELLAEDGDLGPRTIARLQESLNRTGARPRLVVDSDFGPKTKRALQARLNHTHGPVAIDGDIGPQTIRALQRNVGARADGEWGAKTTAALQHTLNRREL